MTEKVLFRDVLIGTSDVLVLGENPLRISATFVNDSDTTIYLNPETPASLNGGIRLNASGGAYEINLTNPYHGEIHAICSAASKKLLVREFSANQ